MKLFEDIYNQVWVWVEDHDENIELSPHFDYEEDALQWKEKLKQHLVEENRKKPK